MKKIIPIIALLIIIGCSIDKPVNPLQEAIDYAWTFNFTDEEKHYMDSTGEYLYDMVAIDNYPFDTLTCPSYDTIINYVHLTIIPDPIKR